MSNIILASKSKIRKQILEKYNINCSVEPSNVDEDAVIAFDGLERVIPSKQHSHNAAWVKLYKNMLVNEGWNNIKTLKKDDTYEGVDVLIISLGIAYAGNINFFFGVDENVCWRFKRIQEFSGKIFVINHDMPSIGSVIKPRLDNKSTSSKVSELKLDVLDLICDSVQRIDYVSKKKNLIVKLDETGIKDDENTYIYDNLKDYTYVDVTYDTYTYVRKTPKSAAIKVKTGYKICRFAQFPNNEKAIMPSILEELLKSRKATKKQMAKAEDPFLKNILDKRQNSIKITANSLYGQTGAKTSTFYEMDVAASTTAVGRKLLHYARDVIENVYSNLTVETKNHGNVVTNAEYTLSISNQCNVEISSFSECFAAAEKIIPVGCTNLQKKTVNSQTSPFGCTLSLEKNSATATFNTYHGKNVHNNNNGGCKVGNNVTQTNGNAKLLLPFCS